MPLTKFATKLCATNERKDLFDERRCFKFEGEIQLSSNTTMTIMEQLKHRDSVSFCGYNASCIHQVLHHITRSLLMS